MGQTGSQDSGNRANEPSPAEIGLARSGSTQLPAHIQTPRYHDIGDIWLEIPQLNVEVLILSVPKVGGTWDVSMLWNRSGYLEGTAFPTRIGNTALTGQAYLANGAPGPLFRLGELRWSDEVVIRGFGYRHIYEVRSIRFVRLKDFSMLAHRDQDWITLLPCKENDNDLDAYLSRMAIQAVLVRVVPY